MQLVGVGERGVKVSGRSRRETQDSAVVGGTASDEDRAPAEGVGDVYRTCSQVNTEQTTLAVGARLVKRPQVAGVVHLVHSHASAGGTSSCRPRPDGGSHHTAVHLMRIGSARSIYV